MAKSKIKSIDLNNDPRFKKILNDEALKFMKAEKGQDIYDGQNYVDYNFSGIDKDGYFLDKNGKRTGFRPSMSLGVHYDEVFKKAKKEFAKKHPALAKKYGKGKQGGGPKVEYTPGADQPTGSGTPGGDAGREAPGEEKPPGEEPTGGEEPEKGDFAGGGPYDEEGEGEEPKEGEEEPEEEEEGPEGEEGEPEAEAPSEEGGEAPEGQPPAKKEGGGSGAAAAAGAAGGAAGAAGALKDEAQDQAKKAVQKVVKEAIKKALMSAMSAVAGAVGWPFIIGCLVLVFIMLLIFGALAAYYAGGNVGKTLPQPGGKDDPAISKLITEVDTEAKSPTGTKINNQKGLILNNVDKEFLESGKVDRRLLALLEYLASIHSQLTISSLISGHTDPKSLDSENVDDPVTNATSSHYEGTAADISTIDFVYKVDKPSGSCQRMVASICGPPGSPSYDACLAGAQQIKLGNLYYYSDKGNPNATNPNANNTSLNTALDQSKIQAELAAIADAQKVLDGAQSQFPDILSKLNQSKSVLINFQNQNLSKMTADQRNQLAAQINQVQAAIDQVSSLSSQVNGYRSQLNDYNSKLGGLQNNVKTIKDTLAKVQEYNNGLGADKSADLDKMINDIATTVNTTIGNLSSVGSQLVTINTALVDTTGTIASQVQSAQTIVNQNQGDVNTYLKNLGSMNLSINVSNVPMLFSTFGNAKQALDVFFNKVEQLAKEFINKTLQQIVDAMMTTLKQQIEQLINDQVNQVLGELGLSGYDQNTLLVLPCVGYVIEGNVSHWADRLIPSDFRPYGVVPNTKYKEEQYTEAVQIHIKWQDDPPDSRYIKGETDDKGKINSLIFDFAYRPEAQRKVHDVLSQSLNFPAATSKPKEYQPTQLITFSESRDVVPFEPLLDKLYGSSRLKQYYGLFSMEEMWAKIHLGY